MTTIDEMLASGRGKAINEATVIYPNAKEEMDHDALYDNKGDEEDKQVKAVASAKAVMKDCMIVFANIK